MRLAHTITIAVVAFAASLANADPLPHTPHSPLQPCPAFAAAGERTLQEVFGVLTGGNSSTFIFSEERRDSTSMDLLFHGGLSLHLDADASSLSLTLLQRGQHTHFLLQGLLPGGLVTDPLILPRTMTQNPGWSLDTIQLNGRPAPDSVENNLDHSWSGLAGFRLTALGNVERPDIGPCPAVPTPAGVVTLALAAAWGMRRSARTATRA
jgi:hypothetical protein